MSATIPSTMLMSDLLKATGYDCPQELQGKTFANSTRGSDVDVESGKEVRYTENGEYTVEPSEGFEAMDAVKVTVDTPVINVETGKSVNITANGTQTVNPSSGYAAMDAVEVNVEIPLEDNKAATIDVSSYSAPVEITPTAGNTAMKKCTVSLANIPSGSKQLYIYSYEQGYGSLLCEASSFENIIVGMKGVMSSVASEYMTGVSCTEKTDESATFRNDDGLSFNVSSSNIPTSLSSILD